MTHDPRHPFPGRAALVAGAARSGLAAARLLRRRGLEVTVCDRRAADAAPEAARALAAEGVRFAWGRDDAELLTGHDFVVWSPGIAVDHPLAEAARASGRPVLGELEVGARVAQAPLVCITGTNGKSTTTDLTGALLRAAGRTVAVCGNIGRAICEVVDEVPASGLLVVEVSSFQLETVETLRPAVATWLNLTPDHLDRHGSLEVYGAMKQRLFARQTAADWAVVNADDPEVVSRRAGAGRPASFSCRGPVDDGAFLAADGMIVLARDGRHEPLLPRAEVRLPGPHNTANVLAALATVLPFDPPRSALVEVLRTYGGLEHRLEPAGEWHGVRFVNDSKATNTDSLRVALQSFPEPVVLIAGGRDKGQDFRPLAPLVKGAVRRLVLIGEGAEPMAEAWADTPHERAATLAEAVRRAYQAAQSSGAVVLLSPGCASFDMFRDYEDRGRRFKDEVSRLMVEGETC
ncbi:MAG: UDP-N-acetylmuramoylalanine-D-glutamate ligase [Candidatus Eisenbacteria bacterium]